MLEKWTVPFVLCVISWLGTSLSRAADPPGKDDPKEVEAALKLIKDQIPMHSLERSQVTAVSNAAIRQVFPGSIFVSVHFWEHPVPIDPPQGMGARNLFVVKDGKFSRIKDGLEKYFRSTISPAKDDAGARTALEAWLALAQVYHNDGMFKFEVGKEIKVSPEKDGRKATGKFRVKSGGTGEYEANLLFDAEGKLDKVSEKNTIKEGMRPIS